MKLLFETPQGIKTKSFSKETDSGTFLPFDSSHPHPCKINIPFNMARRVKALTDDPDIAETKMCELAIKLETSGYPTNTINLAIHKAMQLTTQELLVKQPKSNKENAITFVNTYDPYYPSLFAKVNSYFQKLKKDPETEKMFEHSFVINSQTNAKSLKRIFQHSQFDFSERESPIPRGVSKCGAPRCKTCENILEVDSVYFKNTGMTFSIRASMNCLVRNVIYYIICTKCKEDYIGETTNLRNRNTAHRNNSKDESRAVMEVSRHIFCCGEGYKICPILKVKEDCKITRLVKEDAVIKKSKPSLNRDKRNLLHLNVYVPNVTTAPTE